MTSWQIWRCGKSTSMRMEISLSLTSTETSLRYDHFCCISAFDIRCDGRFKLWTTHAFFTFIWSGWCIEQIENSTDFEVTETDVDIALVMFIFSCFSFSFKIFAKSDVIKVESEPESSMAFITVLFALCITVTGITCKNVRNLSGFVKSCLFVELIVAWCGLSRCSTVWCFLLQPSTRHFIEQIQSFNKWVFEKQFLQIYSLAAKPILSFTGFILNWWQSISRCYSLHNQHVRPFFFSFCFSGSSEAFLLFFLSSVAFMKLEYIFLL